MALPSTKAARDANLDALKQAAIGTPAKPGWFKKETTRLDKESQFLTQVLSARGADNVGALNLREAVKSLQSEVAAYLLVDR